jgi:hypothetical protein
VGCCLIAAATVLSARPGATLTWIPPSSRLARWHFLLDLQSGLLLVSGMHFNGSVPLRPVVGRPSHTLLLPWTSWCHPYDYGVRPTHTTLLLIIPLWIPFLLTLISTVLLCHRDYRATPFSGHCQECGYDLTGNTTGPCPECGATPSVDRKKTSEV